MRRRGIQLKQNDLHKRGEQSFVFNNKSQIGTTLKLWIRSWRQDFDFEMQDFNEFQSTANYEYIFQLQLVWEQVWFWISSYSRIVVIMCSELGGGGALCDPNKVNPTARLYSDSACRICEYKLSCVERKACILTSANELRR